MKIIIVGCGKVGFTLAKNLANEKHDVILIDKSQEVINTITSSVDCMCVVGNGAIQSVLLEAEVDTADYLIACTNSDEINILTCLIARKNSKCKTIARIRDPEYSKQIEYIMKELDITLTINPELTAAREIARILRYPNSISSDAFFRGRLNSLLIEVPKDSKIVGMRLIDINKNLKCNVLICVIERGEEIIIPNGNSVINAGDKLLFVAEHINVVDFFSKIGYAYKQLNSYIIIGASRIAYYLIDIIHRSKIKKDIKLIDIDRKKCEDIAMKYPDISVVCADATEKNILEQEGIDDADAIITLTGIDEQNIILSLYANSKNKKAIAKVNHLNFVETLKDIQVGSVVNPERIAANIMLSYVRASINSKDSNIETLYRLFNERVEALGFKIKDKSVVTDIKLKDLNLKKNVIIAGIFRKGNLIRPNGMDEIKVGDSVVVITKDNIFNDIVDIIEA